MCKILKAAEKRKNFLYNNQPHDDEWDCPYEEIEYFLLGDVFDDKYEYYAEKDDPDYWDKCREIKSPYLKLSDGDLISVFKSLGLKWRNENHQSTFKKELQTKLFNEIDTSCLAYLNNSYEYNMSKINISDVLSQGMLYFLKNYQKKSYHAHDYPYKSLWNDLENNDRISNDNIMDYPVHRHPTNTSKGWLKVLVNIEKDFNEIDFVYWNENEFKTESKVVAWKEITSDDMDNYIDILRKKSDSSIFNRAKAVKDFLTLDKLEDDFEDDY